MKTKADSHGDKVTNFSDKEIFKIGSNNNRLAVTSLDSALNKEDN